MTSTPLSKENEEQRSFRRWVLPTLALLAAALAGGVWIKVQHDAVSDRPNAAPPAVPVQVSTARQDSIPVYLDGLGTVQAFNTVTIKTQVDGPIESILFTEGQMVKKGDLLAVIDPRPFKAALEQAAAKLEQDQASLENAQYLLTKDQQLATQKITTAEQVETQQTLVASIQAQIAQDQAARDLASVQLSYTELRAPIDGRTGFRLVDVGNQVHTTDTNGIVTITQTRPISVVSTQSENDLPAIRAAIKAGPVEVSALTGDGNVALATGTLTLIDNQIDQSSGTARLKSTFPNADEALWPGQFVEIRIRQTVLDNAINVPSPALQRGPNGFFVYVVNSDDTVSVRPVTPGPIDGGRAVISSGLKVGERVVTSGQYRLATGSKISVQDPTATPNSVSKD
ncbi:efflux RND transporter periplasmic adaptor subunit [Rhizobiaceae bacterium n13]|uniref:Efflux RND transporter periplasmic adaptor subunit n=1 Tax=Ferirhizobium litorale TaxID=2927786 RepID=A0AAE3QB39_9HYPH|nr:efflux RND transporter periplasmic adaptor subunit [Fererhizobium litorale]MDI7862209.1 efflux RND transporter periplasmic adaptor subunit [Fererhizobium litorale]MDI7922517.1 efflux RND transporter periplasmic adaptor subunit [Fererhizobium litorale]